ncbi:hypothetical protein STRATTON_88 [Erwinia phage vB_EamM_Stratton]|uniref:Uncharacterized protein n=2 Tax=Erskinevirus EaH2 TaxID=2169883 RepID=A0A1B2IH04_9CAUD|nr:hypothetical protein G173_gp255 [Erwinia phage phiEaH2]AFQ96800.1 hypothetical protein [Erwinia phage phiEaH2]ANZ50513.1 hypothetical protein STRATTON_88 [Erwinia phage vB_EamM_Stratton]
MAVMQNADGSIRVLEDNETVVRGEEKEKVFIAAPKNVVKPDWKNDLAEFRKQLEKK